MLTASHYAVFQTYEGTLRTNGTSNKKRRRFDNSSVLRRNVRRSLRYVSYAPIETTSNFSNSVRSLSEIEE